MEVEIMELQDAIKARRSIRRFRDRPVDDGTIKKILELGHLAPSAGNLQPRDFVVIKNHDTKEKLAKAALNQRFVSDAPIVIAVCANLHRTAHYGSRGRDLYCIQDSAAAIENMLLAVVDLGLACCWVGAFDEHAVSEILNLPSHIRPVAILPIGYSDVKKGPAKRMPLDELVHNEKW